MAINRNAVKPPSLPERVHPCPALGGDVILRGPMASARIALGNKARKDASMETLAPLLLAGSVLDEEKEPIFTEEEWNTWGGQNFDAYLELFHAVSSLWGLGGEPRKN
jgi:hypothetical protein